MNEWPESQHHQVVLPQEGLLVKGEKFLTGWWPSGPPAGAVEVQEGERVSGPQDSSSGRAPLELVRKQVRRQTQAQTLGLRTGRDLEY